jgi:hypothetical protein
MPALLALIPVKDWIYCGLIAAILAGGLWYHRKLIDEGIADQRRADDIASATITAKTAKETANLQARAMTAEQAYDKERADNQNYNDTHPVAPVRLCLTTPARGSIVPPPGAANTGNASSGSATSNIPNLSSGDNNNGPGSGPDISTLLGLLADKADDVSATLREYQTR